MSKLPPIFIPRRFHPLKTLNSFKIVDMVVAKNVMCIGCSNNNILRIVVNEPSSLQNIETVPSKSGDETLIRKLFIDPLGNHLLICLKTNETMYLSQFMKKPKILSKLKGKHIRAVSWDEDTKTAKHTGHILLGTQDGNIFRFSIENAKQREVDLLFSFSNYQNTGFEPPKQPITGLIRQTAVNPLDPKEKRHLVLISTPNFLYQSTAHSFTELFKGNKPLFPVGDFTDDTATSILTTFRPPRSDSIHYAWFKRPGIRYGKINTDALFHSDNSENVPMHSVVGKGEFFPVSSTQMPLSFLATGFHFVWLHKDRLTAMNYLNHQTVFQTPPLPTSTCYIGVAKDEQKNLYWYYTNNAIFQLEIVQDDRHIWKILLNKREFAQSLNYCTTPEQRESVRLAQAEDFYARKDYKNAAKYFAGAKGPSFEDSVLRFIGLQDKEPLRIFLNRKLHVLTHSRGSASSKMIQISSLCTWLTEIYLSEMNQIESDLSTTTRSLHLTNSKGNHTNNDLTQGLVNLQTKKSALTKEFHNFLQVHSDNLNKATTLELISQHGRIQSLLFYCKLQNDFDRVISYQLQRQQFDEALSTIINSKSEHLFYKYSPILMAKHPSETVDQWMNFSSLLKPRNLVPALIEYEAMLARTRAEKFEQYKAEFKQINSNVQKGSTIQPLIFPSPEKYIIPEDSEEYLTKNHAIRYLSFVVHRLGNSQSRSDQIKSNDMLVHDMYLTLLSRLGKVQPLETFLKTPPNRRTIYDTKYALRLLTTQLLQMKKLDEYKKNSNLSGYLHWPRTTWSIESDDPSYPVKISSSPIQSSGSDTEQDNEPSVSQVVFPWFETRISCCVDLYGRLGLYEEAVCLALEHNNLILAKTYAEKPQVDKSKVERQLERLKRLNQTENIPALVQLNTSGNVDSFCTHLWMHIARHVAQMIPKPSEKPKLDSSSSITTVQGALKFLQSSGRLRVEDILPFFPNHIQIEDLKDDICSSLERYNQELSQLKSSMHQSNQAAFRIQKDIDRVKNRFVVVGPHQTCTICKELLLSRHFYAFPCHCAMHSDCLVWHILPLLGGHRRTQLALAHGATILKRKLLNYPNKNSLSSSSQQSTVGISALIRNVTDSLFYDNPPPKQPGTQRPAKFILEGRDHIGNKVSDETMVDFWIIYQKMYLGPTFVLNQQSFKEQDWWKFLKLVEELAARETMENLISSVSQFVSQECPLCGSLAVSLIDRPFVTKEDYDINWKIDPPVY